MLLNFCYIARHNVHDTTSLKDLQDALDRFHHHRKYFQQCRVCPEGFNLPQQHSPIHYIRQICAFRALNGICSSIIESKHIKAVKVPWRRSSRFEAMGQMLLTNQRLNKLAAVHIDFTSRGMLQGTCLSWILIQLGSLPLIYFIHCGTQPISLSRYCRLIESRASPSTCAPSSCCSWQPGQQ